MKYRTYFLHEPKTLTGHTEDIQSLAFSPDGNIIAMGCYDGTIHLWDAKTGVHKRTLTGHTRDIWSVAFSRDGNIIATGSSDGTIRLWDASTGEHKNTLTRDTQKYLERSIQS